MASDARHGVSFCVSPTLWLVAVIGRQPLSFGLVIVDVRQLSLEDRNSLRMLYGNLEGSCACAVKPSKI